MRASGSFKLKGLHREDFSNQLSLRRIEQRLTDRSPLPLDAHDRHVWPT